MTPKTLPRGRHRLTREEVIRSQRERLVRAMAEVIAEKGYARTSVADVLSVARVSRETFYEQFSSKEECFMGAFELAMERLGAALAGERSPGASAPLERFDDTLAAYLDTLASEPALARVFLVEVYAAGPTAVRRRAELQRAFARALADAFGATADDEVFAVEAFIAAIGAMVTVRLVEDDLDGLRALHEPLMRLVETLPVGP